jgi:hypothetical protein
MKIWRRRNKKIIRMIMVSDYNESSRRWTNLSPVQKISRNESFACFDLLKSMLRVLKICLLSSCMLYMYIREFCGRERNCREFWRTYMLPAPPNVNKLLRIAVCPCVRVCVRLANSWTVGRLYPCSKYTSLSTADPCSVNTNNPAPK